MGRASGAPGGAVRGALIFLLSLGLLMHGRQHASAAAASFTLQAPEPALLITEFQYDPPGRDEDREWVEISNLGTIDLPLDGYGLGDEEETGGGEGMLRFPLGSYIAAGESLIIAQTATGFRSLFGRDPHFEIKDTNTAVPDMEGDPRWAGGTFALANDGDEILLLDAQNRTLDAVNYGQSSTFFSPSIPAAVTPQSVQRSPALCDTDSAADWQAGQPDPGAVNVVGECRGGAGQPAGEPHDLWNIGEIQGTGDVSPLLGQLVRFRGVVSGALEDRNEAGIVYYTLFVQASAGEEDQNPATSDAIAVFLGRERPAYAPGDHVLVSGQVTEFFGLTEIDDHGLQITLEAASQPPPAAAPFELPGDYEKALAYLEAHEAMLMASVETLPVVGPTHAGCGFAVAHEPGRPRTVRESADDPLIPPLLVLNRSDVDCSELPSLKTGDFVAGIAGPLTYHFDQYKVVQQNPQALQITQAAPVPPAAALSATADELQIATFNLNDYLDSAAEAVMDLDVRTRKLGEVVTSVLDCPTVVAVQEVGSAALLRRLSTYTADGCGFSYQVSHQESADARGIDVALLTDPRLVVVELVALEQACTSVATGIADDRWSCPEGQELLFSRPPLVVDLRVDGEPFTIIANHFKSKRGGAVETAARRLEQGRHVHELARRRLDVDPQAAVIVLGDFNDFPLSPALAALQRDGLLLDALSAVPPGERYSTIFDGQAQLVDSILISPALVPRLGTAVIPHINADFPLAMAVDESAGLMPYRASDHDPVLITIKRQLEPSPATPQGTATSAPRSTATSTPPQRTTTSTPPPSTLTSTPSQSTATSTPLLILAEEGNNPVPAGKAAQAETALASPNGRTAVLGLVSLLAIVVLIWHSTRSRTG